MNGTADPFVPYAGGYSTFWETEASSTRSTDDTVDILLKLDGITISPKTVRLPHKDPSRYSR